jgi:mannitol 2-dehydrogenase
LEYWETVRGRNQNPKLPDRIDRNCENGSDRQPKFILPSFTDCLEKDDHCVDGLATVSAMWCRFCQGKTESGTKFEVIDKLSDQLVAKAKEASETDPNV